MNGLADGLVEDAHLVELLQHGHQPAQHGDGHVLGGLLHLHHLEAAGEGGVLLEILLVFGPGGRRDGAQLAACEGRFQQVRRIALTRRAAGADEIVRFVDEQDDRDGRGLHRIDHRPQAALELALHAGAGLEQAEVERAQHHIAQGRRHVARSDLEREALHHRRLAHARLAGEDRVVLAPADQDVGDLADFLVAAEDRVDAPGLGLRRQVHRVLGQRIAALGRGAGGALRAAKSRACSPERGGAGGLFRRFGDDGGKLAPQRIGGEGAQFGRAVGDPQSQGVGVEHRPQQMAGPHLREPRCDGRQQPGILRGGDDVGRQGRRAGVAGAQPVKAAGEVQLHAADIDAEMREDHGDVGLGIFQQLREPVLHLHRIMGAHQREAGGILQRRAAGGVEAGNQRL